jgi:hypothetical protein
VLIIQHDGWIVNGPAWREEWKQYDYIGANAGWTEPGEDGKGGNGGFSLRSKRLMESARQFSTERLGCHPEDVFLSDKHRSKLHQREQFEALGFKFATRAVQRDFAVDSEVHSGAFGHHKGMAYAKDGEGWLLDRVVHGYHRTHLGDQWALINEIIRRSEDSHTVHYLNQSFCGDDSGARLREIMSVLDHNARLVLVDLPVTRWLKETETFSSSPYHATKRRWKPGGRSIVYQFDGDPGRPDKLPPGSELGDLIAFCRSHGGVALSKKMTLEECIQVAAGAACFLGVDSGMSHVMHSVGIPTFIIEYQKPIEPFHLGKEYTRCLGTADAIGKVTEFMARGP